MLPGLTISAGSRQYRQQKNCRHVFCVYILESKQVGDVLLTHEPQTRELSVNSIMAESLGLITSLSTWPNYLFINL